jgi:phage shock protein PspC (stress-responsive transcriptional regulator)
MNKTVTINLSGIVFYIEEHAYEMLSRYLNALRSGFANEEGRDEIMADIESRIAEMFQSKLNPSTQVIVQADVDDMIEVMGRPETFQSEEQPNNATNSNTSNQTNDNNRRRGYRRLYRDEDDKVVGGVCSGIGHYFDIDPVWIRGIFAVAFFAFGTGFLLYLVLLIIIPKAKTTSERLEMKGERVTVDSISRTIREEFDDFRSRMSGLGNEMGRHSKNWRDENIRHDRDWLASIGHVLARIFGILFLVVGILLLFGLLTRTFNIGILRNGNFGPVIHTVFADRMHYVLGIIAILLFFGIPLLMLIYKGVRIIFKIPSAVRFVQPIALGLWVLGIMLGVYVGVRTGEQFEADGRERIIVPIAQDFGDTLNIMVNIDPEMENEKKSYRFGKMSIDVSDWEDVHYDGNTLKIGTPELKVVRSENNLFEIYVYKHARGSSKMEAMEQVRKVKYNIQQKGNQLWLDCYFEPGEGNIWRNQEVRVEVRVPDGKVVMLGTQTAKMITDITNVQDVWDPQMAGHYWLMTKRGLSCTDCSEEDIRINDNEHGNGRYEAPQKADSAQLANDSLEAQIQRMGDSIRKSAKKNK